MSVLMYASVVAIVSGVIMMIVASVRAKRPAVATPTTPAQRPRLKRLIIKLLASVAAFSVGGSIMALIVAELIPVLFSSRSTDEQGQVFAPIIMISYPAAGAVAVYLTNRWLNKKLHSKDDLR